MSKLVSVPLKNASFRTDVLGCPSPTILAILASVKIIPLRAKEAVILKVLLRENAFIDRRMKENRLLPTFEKLSGHSKKKIQWNYCSYIYINLLMIQIDKKKETAENYGAYRWTIKRDKISEHRERCVETVCYPKETPPIVKYEFAHFPPVIREDRETITQ
ncbi:hypothetical protein V1478_017956 [Vespula squamosa]|uniref:Uncharacterized protein n=1 Tax=Vespula squamosa TaxID=30214 RepID=A0ABD1ZVR4_VESSQ